jgi:glycosyltransferase involved in cell wall biosynthesis
MSAADLPFCRRVVTVPKPRGYTPAKIARGFLGRWPLPVVNYTSPEMQAALAAILKQEQFDLIHLDSIHMAAYVPMLQKATGAPMVYDWHNIESEAMRRYSLHERSLLRSRYAALTASRLWTLEQRALRETSGHLVCSDRELVELQSRVPQARVAVIENGVDSGFFAASGDAAGDRRRIVFVGSMGYHANAEAAVYFARDIWPGISRRFPQWTFTIVGANPTPAVLALHGSNHVEVTGTVPDVRPFYREARAAIVPLRVGGGTRLKILEAMAAGVPVVSTTLGAEGLASSPAKDILIADREEEWVAHLDALSDGGLWSALSEAGRELIRARYDWEAIGGKLWQAYSEWLYEPAH